MLARKKQCFVALKIRFDRGGRCFFLIGSQASIGLFDGCCDLSLGGVFDLPAEFHQLISDLIGCRVVFVFACCSPLVEELADLGRKSFFLSEFIEIHDIEDAIEVGEHVQRCLSVNWCHLLGIDEFVDLTHSFEEAANGTCGIEIVLECFPKTLGRFPDDLMDGMLLIIAWRSVVRLIEDLIQAACEFLQTIKGGTRVFEAIETDGFVVGARCIGEVEFLPVV